MQSDNANEDAGGVSKPSLEHYPHSASDGSEHRQVSLLDYDKLDTLNANSALLDETTTSDPNSDTTPNTSRVCQPTLLGIPRELRNRIFEYVFGSCVANDSCIDLVLLAQELKALMLITQAPPTQEPLLVCRQLYMEMHNMQTAAFRRFWSSNTFCLQEHCGTEFTFASEYASSGPFYTPADRELKHIKHFAIVTHRYPDIVQLNFSFKDDGWTFWPDCSRNQFTILQTDTYWGLTSFMRITHYVGSSKFAFIPPCLDTQTWNCSHTGRCWNPEVGKGFSADDLFTVIKEAKIVAEWNSIIIDG